MKGNIIRLTEKLPDPRLEPDTSQMWSRRYQWLPAEFLLDKEGEVKISSYINNLPVSSGLYPILAEMFQRVVPLFNRVLSELCTASHRLRRRFPNPKGYYWWNEVDPPEEIFDGVPDDDYETYDRIQEEWMESRVPNLLPIPDFDQANFEIEPKHAIDLNGHRLQVIVKIGGTELTPDKPTFDGGNWHVEVS